MEQYRIETHLHTNHTSKCGWLDAAALAEGYAQAGYAAVAVTDHYNRDTFAYLHIDTTVPGDVTGPFLDGFRRMEEACAKQGVKVYKGAELRFDECENDYLLYNYPEELLARPEEVFHLGIAAFAPLARAAGALLIQAHPYRRKCTPAIACYLDGVEVMGYLYWGPIDVVSAGTGEMRKRYGFVYVDRFNDGSGTLERKIKNSYYRYKDIIESNGEILLEK